MSFIYIYTSPSHTSQLTCIYSRVSEYGLMKINNRGQVIEFAEKPSGARLKSMVSHYIIAWSSHTIKLWMFSATGFPIYATMFLCSLIPTAASRYYSTRSVSRRCNKVSIYSFYGRLCLQERCFVESPTVQISQIQWLWIWNHSISCNGSQCASECMCSL